MSNDLEAMDQLEAVRQQRADRYQVSAARRPTMAAPIGQAAAAPESVREQRADLEFQQTRSTQAFVTLQIGLRVRNPRNNRIGSVVATAGVAPGTFRLRFDDGEEADREVARFESLDGRPLVQPTPPSWWGAAEEGPEEQPLRQERRLTNKLLAAEIRLAFVRKVYAVLAIQLLLTAAIAGPIAVQNRTWLTRHSWLALTAVFLSLLCWIFLACFRRLVRRHPWVFLLVITTAKGVLAGFFSARYTWQSALLALLATGIIFVGMTVYAWTTKTDFTGYAPYFAGAFLVFLAFGLILFLLSIFGVRVNWLFVILDIFGAFLFTAYIVFDTQRILGEWGGHEIQFSIDDWAFASIALYRDIIQIYRHLLRLFGRRRF